MLDEYKKACKAVADALLDWEHLTKNELCRECVKFKGDEDKFNAYFSALLYRYWNLIPKFYLQSSNVASPEDCYGWLVTALMYALEHTRWNDEDSSVYNDPNGPDKVINRCMKSVRLTFYQYINRKKRKENFGVLSLEELQENLNHAFDVEDEDSAVENNNTLDLKNYVVEVFNKKDYFLAYMIDCIMNDSVFDSSLDGSVVFNERRLSKYLRQIDEEYCKRFARTYDIKEEKVLHTLKYFTTKSSNLHTKIEENLMKLKHDPFIISVCGGHNAN